LSRTLPDAVQNVAKSIAAVARSLETPNETDSNCESPAGVTDGLFEIARAIQALASAVAEVNDPEHRAAMSEVRAARRAQKGRR